MIFKSKQKSWFFKHDLQWVEFEFKFQMYTQLKMLRCPDKFSNTNNYDFENHSKFLTFLTLIEWAVYLLYR